VRELDPDEARLIERLKDVLSARGAAAAIAEKTGIAASTVRSYVRQGSIPTALKLAAIAEAAGVSLEWLATGRGPKSYTLTGEDGPAPGLDRELMARVVDCIAKLYKAERIALSDLDLGKLSAEKYVELAKAKPGNLDEILVLIRMLREQLRTQLRAAPPGDDKRQVSG